MSNLTDSRLQELASIADEFAHPEKPISAFALIVHLDTAAAIRELLELRQRLRELLANLAPSERATYVARELAAINGSGT